MLRSFPVDVRQTATRDAAGRDVVRQRWDTVRRFVPGLTLVAIVSVSIVVRAVLASRTASPWIVPDELIYSGLAKSLAWAGEPAIRGVTTFGFGIGYPALLAPAYFLAGDPVQGYAVAKVTNAVLMSLAAVPAYFLARRLLDPPWALLVSALSVAIPSLAYVGVIMTENAFYPLFLAAVLAMVVALERPSAVRQLVVLAAVGGLFSVRAQGLVLLPAFLAAVLIMAVLDARRGRRAVTRAIAVQLRDFRLTWLLLVTGAAVLVLAQTLRGGSVWAVLGAYSAVGRNIAPRALAEWFVYHLGELDLYLGVLPFCASLLLLIGAVRAPTAPRELQVFAVLSACVIAAMTAVAAQVAVFLDASWDPGTGTAAVLPKPSLLNERNLFYVAPLFLVGFVHWLRAGMPRRGGLGLAVALVAALLPITVPYSSSFANAGFQTPAIVPWLALGSHGAGIGAAIFAAVAAALFYLIPRGWNSFAVTWVAASFFVVSFTAVYAIERESKEARAAGIGKETADWIDRAAAGPVVAVWASEERQSNAQVHRRLRAVWLGEFFNRQVTRVYHVELPMPYWLPSPLLVRRGDGLLVDGADRSPVHVRYVLAPCFLGVRGKRVDADRSTGMGLYDVNGPLRVGGQGSCDP